MVEIGLIEIIYRYSILDAGFPMFLEFTQTSLMIIEYPASSIDPYESEYLESTRMITNKIYAMLGFRRSFARKYR
jgi:hypothetical protein